MSSEENMGMVFRRQPPTKYVEGWTFWDLPSRATKKFPTNLGQKWLETLHHWAADPIKVWIFGHFQLSLSVIMMVSAWVMGLSLHLNDVCLWWRTAKNKLFSTKSRTRWEETWMSVQNDTQCIKRSNTNIVKYDKSSSDADVLWSRSETLAVAVKPLFMVWRKESCVWGKTKQQWTKWELTAVWNKIL